MLSRHWWMDWIEGRGWGIFRVISLSNHLWMKRLLSYSKGTHNGTLNRANKITKDTRRTERMQDRNWINLYGGQDWFPTRPSHPVDWKRWFVLSFSISRVCQEKNGLALALGCWNQPQHPMKCAGVGSVWVKLSDSAMFHVKHSRSCEKEKRVRGWIVYSSKMPF